MNNINPIMKDALTGFAPPDATETKELAALSMARRLLDEIASLEESRQRALESRDLWKASCDSRAKAWYGMLPYVEVDTSESSDPQDATSTMLPDDLRETLLVELISEHQEWLDERGAELYREWCDDQKGEAMIARAESRAFDREVL